jgi:3-hydroxybutyryl-CoA dehydrogenase
MEKGKKIRVGVMGSGTMGNGIAVLAALNGHDVVVFDNNPHVLEKAKNESIKTIEKLHEKNKLQEKSPQEVTTKMYYESDLGMFGICNIVIEAIVEDVNIKQVCYSELEQIIPDDCIIGTNTSSLSIALLSSSLKNPKRFLGMHFFNPPVVMKLVEIVPSLLTDIKILTDVKALLQSWGKTTVLAKDTPGFIVNRIARPYYTEALRILDEGIADIPTIDFAMKEIGGFKMGPFELMDLIGNDVNYKVTESIFEQSYFEPRFKPSITQKRLVEAKMLGKKTGRGFYDYSQEIQAKPNTDRKLGTKIFNRILVLLINEAADSLLFSIATKEDIDLAMTLGVNYPKGLFKWADEIGISNVISQLQALFEEYGEDRYRISPMLKRMAERGWKFYN